MKTKEELNAIKEEIKTLEKKLGELTDEELAQVSGGIASRDLEMAAVKVSVDAALQGKVAGVQTTSHTGKSGASATIRVRGVGATFLNAAGEINQGNIESDSGN